MGRLLLSLFLVFFCAVSASAQQPVLGLDHIPVVVKDLARAKQDFVKLGFVLKPGRPHDNGLRNAHVKFADGTEIELITPPESGTEAGDALSSQYVDWLREGDGAVSLGLYRPGKTPAPPPGVFFAGRQKSPTDLPEHFDHPNDAIALSGVWLAGSPVERKLANLPGARVAQVPFCAPFGFGNKVVRWKEGELFLLPESQQIVPGRSIVAATVTVRSLAAVQGVFAATRTTARPSPGCARNSLWVETHGLWLEFIEQ
jgi:catechol 2,3-dioxygenase-like lactoylglutathione lyase family enzyme